MNAIPAGWYGDPLNASVLRWWDGSRWTGHTSKSSTPITSAGTGVDTVTGTGWTTAPPPGVHDESVKQLAEHPASAATSRLVVRPWARFGHYRLYVQDADGVRLGYWDNKTGAAVVEDGGRCAEFDAAIAAHLAQRTGSSPASTVRVGSAETSGVEGPSETAASPEVVPPTQPGPSSGAADGPWRDLALNRPGESARTQAIAHKQAAPVKTVLARVLGVHNDERAWRIGADGEEAVALQLLRLPVEWKLLYAVPVGERGSDIDHVVIGPGGVYTINAKHHPDSNVWVGGDTFMVNGRKYPYVRNSRYEARRAARMLGTAVGFHVPATGLIVVVGAHRGMTIKAQPPGGDVFVIGRKQIENWLERRVVSLNADKIETIYTHARKSTTWA